VPPDEGDHADRDGDLEHQVKGRGRSAHEQRERHPLDGVRYERQHQGDRQPPALVHGDGLRSAGRLTVLGWRRRFTASTIGASADSGYGATLLTLISQST
jgi:hypothetical protein